MMQDLHAVRRRWRKWGMIWDKRCLCGLEINQCPEAQQWLADKGYRQERVQR